MYGALAVAEAFREHVVASDQKKIVLITDMLRALIGTDGASRQARPANVIAHLIEVIDGLTLANSDKPLYFDGTVLPW